MGGAASQPAGPHRPESRPRRDPGAACAMPDVTARPRRSRRLSHPSAARRIFGLDFSGATDAGRRAWLAEGRTSPAGLEILSCRPIAALPGSAVERTSALAALRAFIGATPDGIFGCDF